MGLEVKTAKVAVFSQNKALLELCKSETEALGASCDTYVNFLQPEDARFAEVRIIIVDVEHPDESGVHWLEKLRQFPALRGVPVLLLSAFMTDAQADALRKRYSDTAQIHMRVPVSVESFRAMVSYYLERDIRLIQALPKAVGSGQDWAAPALDQEENMSLKELYERELVREAKEDIHVQNAEVIHLEGKKSDQSIYQEKDIEALHRYIEVREKEIFKVAEALGRSQERLDQVFATVEHLRLELAKAKKTREDVEIKYLTLKDESERFRMISEQEKQALIEDFQIKLAHKEILEGNNKELKDRLEVFKQRIREEVKMVRKHERDLEQKINILQSDTDLLLQAKDGRILELSKKIEDLYEQIGRLNERIRHSEETVVGQFDKEGRVLKALRLASSLLEEPEDQEKAG